jgi:hypothetical protein
MGKSSIKGPISMAMLDNGNPNYASKTRLGESLSLQKFERAESSPKSQTYP